jgi:YD repeat-containing protein
VNQSIRGRRSQRVVLVAVIVVGLMVPSFAQAVAIAASPSPSPILTSGAGADCNPAKGPPLNSRFQGIGRVALFNGVYSFDRVDLWRTGSIAATFARGYVSADTRSNHLGTGWTGNYDVRIRLINGTADLAFTNPDGFVSTFPNGYNGPTRDRGLRLSLTPPPPNWVVTDGFTTWTLGESSGNLIRVETPGGSSVDIRYGGDLPTDTIGPDGSGVRFKLDAKGRFVQVTDRQDAGRWIKFTYDAKGRLSRVEPSSGGSEQYAYLGDSQQIQTISSGDDEPLLRLDYDERGRTIKERDADGLRDGQGVEYRYHELVDASVETTVTYPESRLDPSWRPIQAAVHDPDGNLRELRLQPTRTETYVGRYDYDGNNRRVILQSACDRIGADGKPEPPDPWSLVRDGLTRLLHWIWLILAPF